MTACCLDGRRTAPETRQLSRAWTRGNPQVDYDELIKATDALTRLGVGEHLKTRIRRDRGSLRGKQRQAAERTIALHDVDELLLSGAITIKNLAGQGNIVIHAVGILVALPHYAKSPVQPCDRRDTQAPVHVRARP